MQTGHGKRAALLTVSLMLSACGGGGGGTVATPPGTVVLTTPLTSWTDSVQPNAKVQATGLGKQTTYTYENSRVTSIPDDPVPGDVTASAIFEFDETAALTLVTLNSNGSLSGGPASDLAADHPDFVKAAGGSSKAVVSSPESGAWDYQSFGVWENGLGAGVTTRSAGAMSVGSLTPADQVRLVEGATFTGKIVGSYINPEGLGHTVLSGLTVELSGPSLIFSTSNPLVSPDPFNGVPVAPPSDYDITTNLNLQGSITYVEGTNTFSGTLSTLDGKLSGNSTGQFYGPNAVELGGVFFLPSTTSVETYSGAYGAVRPAP